MNGAIMDESGAVKTDLVDVTNGLGKGEDLRKRRKNGKEEDYGRNVVG